MAESDKFGGAPGMVTRAEQQGSPGDISSFPVSGDAPVGDKQVGQVTPGRLQPATPSTHARAAKVQGSPSGGAPLSTSDSGNSGRSVGSSPAGGSLNVFIGVSDEQGMRSYMEDRHTVITDFKPRGARDPNLPRQFAAVYDGHSSHHGSEHASRRVHQFIAAQPAIQQCMGDACDQPAVEAALKAAFEDVDQEIVDTAMERGRRYGTTAVCALRIGTTLYIAHAGDSRAVLCRNGRAITLTRDHKPASVPEERQRIESQGGRIAYEADRVLSNPEGQRHSRLNMSRALGDPDFKEPRRLVEAEPDVARVELHPGADTFLLMGSDGLFDVMTGQQAVDTALRTLDSRKGRPSNSAAETVADVLVDHAMKLGTSDNVTALVMLFDWA